VDWIQLRDRSLDDETSYQLAGQLVLARDQARMAASPRVIVNKRVDIALAARADGVHLGFDALGDQAARTLLGDRALLGASLHSVEEVEAAAGTQFDYAHLAPIWDPLSKEATRPALGPAALERACRAGLPILAQGGLDPLRAAEAIEAGAAGIAVTGILGRAENPAAIARHLRAALDDRSRLGDRL
jgi:thiamine-phosphate pyrophosphorylase